MTSDRVFLCEDALLHVVSPKRKIKFPNPIRAFILLKTCATWSEIWENRISNSDVPDEQNVTHLSFSTKHLTFCSSKRWTSSLRRNVTNWWSKSSENVGHSFAESKIGLFFLRFQLGHKITSLRMFRNEWTSYTDGKVPREDSELG